MDSKILFDKIDNCFIKFRNSNKNIRRKFMSKTYLIVTTQDMPNVSSKLVSKGKRPIFDYEMDSFKQIALLKNEEKGEVSLYGHKPELNDMFVASNRKISKDAYAFQSRQVNDNETDSEAN